MEKLAYNSTFRKLRSWHLVPSWQIGGETMETVTDFNFGGLQNHCRWWLQPWNEKTLTLWKKRYDQPPWILKSRDITLPTKVHLVKAMVFPVVIYGCESWIIKKAELQRIYTFELWCWRRLENPLDCKEIQPVHPKGDHSWILIGTTHVESETPVLLPGISHGQRSLVGCSPWGH